jgi:hypothetical protein
MSNNNNINPGNGMKFKRYREAQEDFYEASRKIYHDGYYEPFKNALEKWGPNIVDEEAVPFCFSLIIQTGADLYNPETKELIEMFVKHPKFKYINLRYDIDGTTFINDIVSIVIRDVINSKKNPPSNILELIQTLLDYGANPYIKNRRYISAFNRINNVITEVEEEPELGVPLGGFMTIREMFRTWHEKEYGQPLGKPKTNNRYSNNNNSPEVAPVNNSTNQALTENLNTYTKWTKRKIPIQKNNTNTRNVITPLNVNQFTFTSNTNRNNNNSINSYNENDELTRNLQEGPINIPSSNNNNASVREVEENNNNTTNNNASSTSTPPVNISRINYGGGRRKTLRKTKKRKATRHRR